MPTFFLKQPMMNKVLYSLLPITLWGIFLFGWRVLAIIVMTNLAAVGIEYLFVRTKKDPRVTTAALVTGTLLALSLPPTIPLWMAMVGGAVAILFGKMAFGGFGMNLFNPAILGRTFLYISFPQAMASSWLTPFHTLPGGFSTYFPVDNMTSATYLGIAKFTPADRLLQALTPFTTMNQFLGFEAGSIGEVSVALILLAAIYLIVTKTANWRPMLSGVIGLVLAQGLFSGFTSVLVSLCAGGAMFGIVFMITDPVSMPKQKIVIWIYGFFVGFLTVFIRRYSSFVEGFMFALLLGNMFMPILEYAFERAAKPVAKKGA
jgi:Na+-transporting NADH:ubiquinone oxidoreductase subunit B